MLFAQRRLNLKTNVKELSKPNNERDFRQYITTFYDNNKRQTTRIDQPLESSSNAIN